ncbi:hypothetical protein F4782DRAFT_551568 [Xylaria castorea]|nr:hypothetical protein F4782DRAFT_551568 [Xylaria castorea]
MKEYPTPPQEDQPMDDAAHFRPAPPQEDQPMDDAVNVQPAPPTSLDLYNRGEPLWTKCILEDIRAQFEDNIPLFVVHCLDDSTGWLGYTRYAIRQRCCCDPEYPYMFPQYGFAELDRAFKIASKDWSKHETRHKFSAALLGQELPPTINKIICFGLGNHLTKKLEYWTQHPAAITIRNAIRLKLGHKVRLLTHLPEYTADTKAVLEKYGFEVIGMNGVDGFIEVDENSVVFSTPSDTPVKQILAELARPAVIITRPFREADLDWVDKSDKSDKDHLSFESWSLGMHDRFDPDTPRTKAMFADYIGIPLWEASGETAPGLWGSWLKTEMQVYVRNEDCKPMKTKSVSF